MIYVPVSDRTVEQCESASDVAQGTGGAILPKVHVQLYQGKDAERYRARYRDGIEPDETPYGFHLAQDEGFEVTFSKDGPRNLFAKVVNKLFDFDLVHAWRNRHAMSEADVIWTMTEGEAFAAALLMKLGAIPRRPILSNAVWLLNRWPSLTWLRRWSYAALSDELTVMTVHSLDCLPIAKKAFPKLRSELMYFGINVEYFPISAPKLSRDSDVIHIVSAGNDRTRDWDSLLDAFGGDKRFRVTLVCAWLDRARTAPFENVSLLHTSSMSELRDLYRDADVIAVPMRKNVFSGITVALEAAALGKPILCTETGGVPTYFDRDQVIYAAPGDAGALREALLATTAASRKAAAERAQARFLERDYSTRGLIARYSNITRELLSRA